MGFLLVSVARRGVDAFKNTGLQLYSFQFAAVAGGIMLKRQPFDFIKKKPQQKRANDTIDTLLEATAQVLHDEGLKGASTNAVADRAGFGVGTLYQYFRNKDDLFTALAEREVKRVESQLKDLADRSDALSADETIRTLARILIHAFGSRPKLRRTILFYMVPRIDLMQIVRFTEEVSSRIYEQMRWRDDIPMPSRTRFGILTRGVIGAVRGTLIASPETVLTPAFEDEIVALIKAYLYAPPI
jgi:AcrR family transcriptional regulator